MNSKWKEILSYVVIVIVVLLIKQFIVTPIRVNGTSMNPTLVDKDIMILDKISYRFIDIKRFEIIVIDKEAEYLIKRVIGLPGEKVEFKDNVLYINGKIVKEDFTHFDVEDFVLDEVIPEGYYFVVGDNRPDSLDSRYIGLISKKEIIGRTSFTIFPFKRFGNKI